MTSISSSYGIFDVYPMNQVLHYDSWNNDLFKTSILVAKESSPQNKIDFCDNFKLSGDERQKIIKDIQGGIFSFAKVLSQIDLFKREFYMIMSIQNIFDYICKDSFLFSEHFDYLMETFDCFFEIFNFKIDNFIEMDCDDDIKKEYKKLSRNFLKQQGYFYKEIYESVEDETFIDDMTRILAR